MKKENAIKSVESQELYSSNPNGETWTSESIHRHQRSYYEDQTQNNPSCLQIKMRKSDYQQIKQDAIPQRNSRAINQALQENGPTPKNLINNERLHAHPHGKVNLSIKGQTNLDNFNAKVVEVKIIDPKSMQYNNTITKFVGTHGKPTVTACIPQGVQQNEEHKD
jgi:hypothetical protein